MKEEQEEYEENDTFSWPMFGIIAFALRNPPTTSTGPILTSCPPSSLPAKHYVAKVSVCASGEQALESATGRVWVQASQAGSVLLANHWFR